MGTNCVNYSMIYLDTQMRKIFNKGFSRIKTEHEHKSSSFHDYLHYMYFLYIQNELEVKNTTDTEEDDKQKSTTKVMLSISQKSTSY